MSSKTLVEKKKEQIRKMTFNDLMNQLKQHSKCALIRPTGFGKTYMLTKLIKSYKKILYLYPAEVIKQTVVNRYYEDSDADAYDKETKETMTALGKIDNVILMTYAKLIRLTPDEIRALDVDLIITDECHRLGGARTMIAIGNLLAAYPNAHFVGATATPIRGDTFDVVHTFFDDVTVFPYTLHDAITDNLLPKPTYCYCTTDIETDLKDEALMAGEDINDLRVQEVLKKELIEISNLYSMDKIIKENCDKYVKDTNYMKYIVFFSCFEQMHDKDKDVIEWFKTAYPNHKIRTLYITSETIETRKNVNKLSKIDAKNKTIDLIFCIDMLNMGYHVDNLTGVIMYRGTSSDIIYIQQLGRALSSGATETPLIFDVVDNLHRKAIFTLPQRFNGNKPPEDFETAWEIDKDNEIDPTKVNRDLVSININDKNEFIDKKGQKIKLYFTKDKETNQVGPFIADDKNHVYNIQGKKLRQMWVDNTTGVIMSHNTKTSGTWWNDVNTIDPMDLEMSGTIASYKELMAKAVAEPMVQRCKEAWEAHFNAWCEAQGYEYPLTDTERQMLFSEDKEKFTETYRKLIAKNGWDYPMQDAQKLRLIGKTGDKFVNLIPPIEIFSKWKNVSVSAILDLLGIA